MKKLFKRFPFTLYSFCILLVVVFLAEAITKLQLNDEIRREIRDYESKEWDIVEAEFISSEKYSQREQRGWIRDRGPNGQSMPTFTPFDLTFEYYRWTYSYQIDGVEYVIIVPEQEFEAPDNQQRMISVKSNDPENALPYANTDELRAEFVRLQNIHAKVIRPVILKLFLLTFVCLLVLDLLAMKTRNHSRV